MEEQKQHVIDSLKGATNVLVTVRSNPSLDQLAACIALTLILNELDKHGTAVFSGRIPSVLDFLEPEKTLERTTDSLRDFIISLDKAKADKLRYKVEDTVVKIYITPYRTSLTSDDLEFGQGDFNVDVVVALGVHIQEDLDEAITAHGRILHDATVISINTDHPADEGMGSINWVDTNVSSLSEMVAGIAGRLGKEDIIDNQIATALLTGIVAETERFGNAKTTPATMETAAKLLTAGANQELVANKLNESAKPEPPEPNEPNFDQGRDGQGGVTAGPVEPPPVNAGELAIEHQAQPEPEEGAPATDDQPLEQPPLEPQAGPTEQTAREGVGFDVPQDEEWHEDDNHAGQPADQPALQPTTGEGQVPPVFGPSQVSDDERTALDFLKERQFNISPGNRIEPLHPRDSYAEQAESSASVGQVVADNDRLADPGAANANLDANKFALTPPSLGGTLTANLPAESVTPPMEQLLKRTEASAPAAEPTILKHEKSTVGMVVEPSPQPVPPPQPPAPALQPEPAPAPAPMPAPESHSEPVSEPKPEPAPTPEPAPAVTPAPMPEPKPAVSEPAPVLQAALAPPEPLPAKPAPKPMNDKPPTTESPLSAAGSGPKMEAAMADPEPLPAKPAKKAADAKPAEAEQSGPKLKLEAAPTIELPVPKSAPAATDMPPPPLPTIDLSGLQAVGAEKPASPPPPVPPPILSTAV